MRQSKEVIPQPPQPLSHWWRHGTLLVMMFGFTVLAVVTVLTYTNAPPIPQKVVDPAGGLLFSGGEIERGQEVFLKHALMEHGTLWGHGAYLGPDYAAEYLPPRGRDSPRRPRHHPVREGLHCAFPAEQSVVADEVRAELKGNRYDASTDTLKFSAGQVAASKALEAYWAGYFSRESSVPGLPPGSISDPSEIRLLNAYFAWATWATVTNRPGENDTYTNNWPYDPDAGNHPSTQAYVWSALSLVALLGGLGLALLIFGKYHFLGSSAAETLRDRRCSWTCRLVEELRLLPSAVLRADETPLRHVHTTQFVAREIAGL